MARLIRALGGEPTKATIHDVSDGETYHARFQISQRRSPVVVEMRLSDAITLAVVCNAPIYVERLVWQKAPG
jgi:bifunctional DNase/RNase